MGKIHFVLRGEDVRVIKRKQGFYIDFFLSLVSNYIEADIVFSCFKYF